MTIFKELNEENELFSILAHRPPSWWNNLKDPDNRLVIEVRKNNYIDVYYNGGALIKKLKYSPMKCRLIGEIHFKYIPVDSKKDYISYNIEEESIEVDKQNISIMSIDNFNKGSLSIIKKRIERFYPSKSEKGIQYRFIINDPYYIDSEFEYRYNNKIIRIDLVRIDVTNKSIVFVEVKTKDDDRLFNDEIIEQLKKYHMFIKDNKEDLLEYYTRIFNIKKRLNILPKGLENIDTLSDFKVVDKPLLLLGDCSQNWINLNSKYIDEKIRDYAIGSYYFGDTNRNCDILSNTKGNRHIFNSL